jgi:mannose-1-phosphate guanylyltransferase/mannose-6-phosphate isomerase
MPDAGDPIIVTNKDHADAIMREMAASGYRDFMLILEPVGRNTAPAVAVAAMEAMKIGDPLMLILPADHTIADEDAFRDAIDHAARTADAGYLVTFGIPPSRPETGYGYIRIGASITSDVDRVAEFKEKPDEETARSYLESGDYLWNSGMFLIKASKYLEELEQHAPDIAACAASAFAKAETADGRMLLDPGAFSGCRSESIDYAIMEQTSMAAVVPTDPGWNDVGSWSSLFDIAEKDDNDNVLIGDVVAVETSGTYARSSGRLVATVGINDLIIVETPDAVLVAHTDSAQDVKSVVEELRDADRSELENDGTVLAPWGQFRTIDQGPGFRVLHLRLDPGSKTSLKSHRHRSEHWIVIRGTARVTTGETTRLVPMNESVSIPPNELHRLENPGDDILEVIEVNIGTYIGEDDITRYMDTYGRTEREG